MTAIATILLAAAFTRPLERVASLDPIRAQAVYDSRAVMLYCETPLEIDYEARPYKLIPCVCELPEVSGDGLVYTLKMRRKGLTSGNVKRCLERLRDPQLVSPGGWTMKNVSSIETPDDETVVFRLSSRSHVFPWMLAMSYAAVRREDGSGTGPYTLKSWWKNHEMVYVRNPEWPGWADAKGTPFDEVHYLVIDDVSTQWLMFLKGEIDFLGEISRDNWDALVDGSGKLDPRLEAEGVRLFSTPSLDVRYIGFNMRDPVLGPNKPLRQALTCAFDFPRWKNFYGGRVEFADGPVPPGVDGRLNDPSPFSFDIERAKSLLAEAGYPNGIDPASGRRLVLSLSIGRPTQDSREQGELLASFFEKIGVRLELSFHTWEAFLRAVNEGRGQMYMMGWVGDYPDAENYLQLFHSKNISPGPNHSDYKSKEFDKEFDAAMSAESAEQRNVHWRECQRIVREDCPWIFTHYPKSYALVRPRVGNYIPSDFPYGNEKHLRLREK